MKTMNFIKALALGAMVMFAGCQKPADGSKGISASPSSINFNGDGETVNVSVEVADGAQWTYQNNAAGWVTVEVDGNSMKLKAFANDTGSKREGSIRLICGSDHCTVLLSQGTASAVPGYIQLPYGSAGYLSNYMNSGVGAVEVALTSEDEQTLFRIVLFVPAEEGGIDALSENTEMVFEIVGSYDKFTDETFTVTPGTCLGGGVIVIEDEEGSEELEGGTILYENEHSYYMTSGTVTLAYEEESPDAILIKIDAKDDEGNEYKYCYKGVFDIEFDETLVMATYTAPEAEGENAVVDIMIMDTATSGITSVSFYTSATSVDELQIEGTYSTDKGSLIPYNASEFTGSFYISYATEEITPAGEGSTVQITKNEDETYKFEIYFQNEAGAYSKVYEALDVIVTDSSDIPDYEE